MKHFLASLLLLSSVVSAQKLPTVDEKTKDMKKQAGFLNYYWEEATGKIWLEISKSGQEILYLQSMPAGLGSNDIGLDRGLPGDTRIVKFTRTGRKILMIEPNYNYRAITSDRNEKKAVEQSFAQSTLWGFNVEAESDSSSLVDATDFLLRDAMKAANQVRNAQQGNYAFDQSRSAILPAGYKKFPAQY